MANTYNLDRRLEAEGEGEMDYDYVNDILFFKVKDREYNFSLEFNNIVIDVDSEQFITGIQIFEASKFLRIPKESLRKVANWKFKSKLENNEIRIDLYYQVIVRNQVISNNIYPIFVQNNNNSNLPNQMVSVN